MHVRSSSYMWAALFGAQIQNLSKYLSSLLDNLERVELRGHLVFLEKSWKMNQSPVAPA